MSITKSGVESLLKALETDMFYGPDARMKNDLKVFLGKLGIKSAKSVGGAYLGGGVLHVESLEGIMKQVTFDDTKLKLHRKTK
jgi:hypothetical protein